MRRLSMDSNPWLDAGRVEVQLAAARRDPARLADVLARGRSLAGLRPEDAAFLSRLERPEELEQLFDAARAVKEEIYGPRVVLFAPLYLSSHCVNECSYCAFRSGHAMPRRTLTRAEVAAEAAVLCRTGHKRVLLVAGEAAGGGQLDQVIEAIRTLYAVREGAGEIRRVNVNLAPLPVEGLRRLAAAGIGTYQVFQETYHAPTYRSVHLSGPKADFGWRLSAMDRAMEAGIEDVGVGPLLGLHDWRFELLALLQHVAHLESTWGVGPHTISVPRLEPAEGSAVAARPPHPVSDADFLKLVAILRLAVPYTGIILSTREAPEVRRRALALGVSQISAGSRTDVGGYAGGERQPGQFQLGDPRSLDAVVRDLAELGLVPSFCTACYRLGRTGGDFMDLARPGAIKAHCDPNALSTLCEYLHDHASPETAAAGLGLLRARLSAMGEGPQLTARALLAQVHAGRRDVFT